MPNEHELTEQQLKIGSWYIAHKALLKRIGFGIFIVLDAVLVIIGLWGIINFYLIGWTSDLRLRQSAASARISGEAVYGLSPEPLRPISVHGFAGTGGKTDFAARVQNVNENWYAVFSYRFASGGAETRAHQGFILPREEKFLLALAEDGMPGKGADFLIEEIVWRRVNRREIRDPDSWVKERNNFLISDIAHSAALSGERSSARTSFKIENRTGFGYWSVYIPVALLRGETPLAVNAVTLDRLDAGETREVKINWFEQVPLTAEVLARPEINFFDGSVYMPPGKE